MKHPYLAKLLFLLLFLCAGFTGAFAQNGSVSGRVLDEQGQGLPGVTVLIEGTQLGNSTNSDGTYAIQNIPAGPHTLIVSFVGFTTSRQAITITAGQNTAVPNLTLNENTTLLSEAVVVGYGVQRRQDVTGAVTTVSERDFVQGQVTTPEQLINGKVAGVQITGGGGAPGAANTIRIRGGSSLNATNDPLIVIDGVPVNSGEVRGTANPLNLINPNDIETFTVLKDASATAIYGSRASNGVILITTKKGIAGEKTRVNVSSLFSVSHNPNRIDALTGDEFRSLVNQRGTEDQKALLGRANTDWQDAIFRTAFTQNYNASVSGNAGILPYRVALGHLNQDGVIKTNNLKRNTASISLNPTLLDGHLRVDANVKGSWVDNRFVEESIVSTAVFFDPTQPITLSGSPFDGYFEYFNTSSTGAITRVGLAPANPLARLQQRQDRSTVKRSIGNIQLDYKLHFLPDLRANLNLGYDITRSKGRTFVAGNNAISEFNPNGPGGVNNRYEQDRDNKLLEFYFNYSKELGNAGRLEALAGYSYQDFIRDSPLIFDRRPNGDLINPADTLSFAFPDKSQYTLISYYGRLNYNLKDRYLITATLRQDISSRFAEENRKGLFPALSVAWRIKGESFLTNSNVFSELKLRAGYGITGQQDIGVNDYPAIARYINGVSSVSYPVGGVYTVPIRLAPYDRNIKWEETTTYNIGLDYGFFDGRLTGTADVYLRETKDLLNEFDVPAGSNATNRLFTNVGSLENRGLELGLNGVLVQKTDFTWNLNANATFNRNKITQLTLNDNPSSLGQRVGGIGGGTGTNIQTNSIGFPTRSFFVYKQKYDSNGRPIAPTGTGVNAFEDLNGDGIINERDLYRYQSPAPRAILGLSSNLTYQRLNFAFTMRAYLNNYVYNNIDSRSTRFNIFPAQPFLSNTTQFFFDSQAPGEGTLYRLSDYYVRDASFLRLDNVTLGYTLGAESNINVSLAVQNAFVITKYDGVDPEIFDGIDNTFYPRARTYTLGVNVNF